MWSFCVFHDVSIWFWNLKMVVNTPTSFKGHHLQTSSNHPGIWKPQRIQSTSWPGTTMVWGEKHGLVSTMCWQVMRIHQVQVDSQSYSRNMRRSVATSRNITESGTRVATNVYSQSCKHLIMFLYLLLSGGNVINPFCYIIFEYQPIVISLLLIHNTQQLFPLGNVQWSFGPFRALGKGCYRPTIMIHGAVSTIRQIWLRVSLPY